MNLFAVRVLFTMIFVSFMACVIFNLYAQSSEIIAESIDTVSSTTATK